MIKKLGECKTCGETRPLMSNGYCGSCSGKRGGRPAREAAMADALATVLSTGHPVEASSVLPKKQAYKDFWADLMDEGEQESSIEDERDSFSLDSPAVLIVAAVLVVICYAMFGDQLREMISKLTSGITSTIPKTEASHNPYKGSVS
jgi:hypothetical protein